MDGNIQKYLSFVKTVECGSFTRAAELLNYSQSGISRMIRDLEDEWNIILLERGKAGVRLTSDGMALLPYAKSLISEYEKLLGEINDLSGLQSGLVRIGALEPAARSVLPQVIAAFSRDYPGIGIDIMTGSDEETSVWLEQGMIDISVSKLPAPGDMESVFLTQDRLMAVFPAAYAPPRDAAVPPATLCDYPFIMPEKGMKQEITLIFENSGLSPRAKISASGDQTVLSLAEKGLGVTIMPGLSLRGVSYGVEVRELDLPAYIDFGVIFKNRKTASLAVRRLLDYFVNV